MAQNVISRSKLEQDENWARSIGKKWYGIHYRERDGTRHAVCLPGSDTCHVHEDAVNAHDSPLQHLFRDAPELLVLAGIGLLFGPKAVKKAWKFLP